MVVGDRCVVCKGGYSEARLPMLLPACGHSLCQVCLIRLAEHRAFTCPNCRVKQPKVTGTEGKPMINHALLALIASTKGDHHHHPKPPAPLLDFNMTHQPAAKKDEECESHVGVRLAYFCNVCKVPACGECVVEGHLGTEHKPIKICLALEEKRRDVQSRILEVTAMLDDVPDGDGKQLLLWMDVVMTELKLDLEAVQGKIRILTQLLVLCSNDVRNRDEKKTKMRAKVEELLIQAPDDPEAMKGLRQLQEYEGKVWKLQREVKKEIGSTTGINHLDTTFLSDTTSHARDLNTRAASLLYKMANQTMREIVVEECGGKVCVLRWNYGHLHLHYLRVPGEVTDLVQDEKKFYLKWNFVQSQLHEISTVFLDFSCKGEQKRLYFELNREEPNVQCFLNLCIGKDISHENVWPMQVDIKKKEEVANGRATLVGLEYQLEKQEMGGEGSRTVTKNQEENVNPQEVAQHFKLGDVVSEVNEDDPEILFWLMTDCGEGKKTTQTNDKTTEKTGKRYQHVASYCGTTDKILTLFSREDVSIVDCGAVLCQKGEEEKPWVLLDQSRPSNRTP